MQSGNYKSLNQLERCVDWLSLQTNIEHTFYIGTRLFLFSYVYIFVYAFFCLPLFCNGMPRLIFENVSDMHQKVHLKAYLDTQTRM